MEQHEIELSKVTKQMSTLRLEIVLEKGGITKTVFIFAEIEYIYICILKLEAEQANPHEAKLVFVLWDLASGEVGSLSQLLLSFVKTLIRLATKGSIPFRCLTVSKS